MSSPITDERDAILALLPDDVGEKFNHVPGRFTPPAALALWAGMDREAEDTFDSLTNRYELWLVTASGPNDVTTAQLDKTVFDTAVALSGSGFAVDSIDQPFTYQVQGANYLTAIIRISHGITLTD